MPSPCPHNDDDWLSYAAGLLSPEQNQDMRKHAASCESCAERLRSEIQALRDEPSEEEARFVESLESADPSYQRGLSYRLAEESTVALPARKRSLPLEFWKIAFPSAAALAAGVMLTVYWGDKGHSADNELAEAYGEDRVLAMRFEGAPFAPLKPAKREGRSGSEESASLDEAKATITRELATHPGSPEWLHRKGRALLLSSRPEEAVEELTKASRLGADTPSIDIDLASAFHERCQTSGLKQDCATALSRLNEVVTRNPHNAVARFNRALAFESLDLVNEAEEEWKAYLAIDSTSPWSKEAKRLLAELQERKKRSSIFFRGPPSELNIEAAIDTALTEWLPESWRTGSPSLAAAGKASILATEHHDLWLRDLLRSDLGPRSRTGIITLSDAIRANGAGNFAAGQRSLTTALHLLIGSANRPAILRAKLEQIYLLHRENKQKACQSLAGEIAPALDSASYIWLGSFLRAEVASCQAAIADFTAARANALLAIKSAEFGNYPELGLRAQGILASIEHELGNSGEAWNLNVAGLDKWWSSSYRPMRAYQFYMDLSLAAREQGESSIALAMAREAQLQAIATHHRLAQRFAVIERARAALDSGEVQEAKVSFATAETLAQEAPIDPSYGAEVQIGLARLDLLAGRPGSAESRLNNVEQFVRDTQNTPLSIDWTQTSANAARIQQKWTQYEHWLRILVSFANAGLLSLTSEADRVRWVGSIEAAHRNLAGSLWNNGLQPESLAVLEQFRGMNDNTPSQSVQVPWNAWHGESQLKQALLHDGEGTVLSYAILDGSLRIWLYGSSQIQWASSPLQLQQILELASRFTEHTADLSTPIFIIDSESRALYSALINPIESWLPKTGALTVEAEGPLWTVPWEALQSPASDLLADRFRVTLSPGFAYRARLKSRLPLRRESRVMLLIPPVTPGQRSLTDINQEEATIRKQFLSPAVFSGAAAPWSDLSGQLPAAEVLHYAGHSSVRNGHTVLELPVTPQTTKPMTLTCADLPRCRLVVLSACSTVGHSAEQAVGAESLVRPFLACGVPYVLASRWLVDSAVSARTMDLFYAKLLAGLKPAAALQASMLTLRADSRTAHPYYWAAFTLFGSAE